MNKNENLRASGRTTRLVDKAIQDLFTTGKAIVKDCEECSEEVSKQATMVLVQKIRGRLFAEHKATFDVKSVNGVVMLTLISPKR